VQNLASLREQEGRLTEALEELRRLLGLAPGNIEARLRLAGILRGLENWPEAIEHYEAVLAAQPDNPEALRGIALAWAATGARDKALACYGRLEKLGGDPSFRLDRARLWMESGEIDRARKEVLHHLESSPDDHAARVLLADIHAKQGHARQAAQTLVEVLEVAPDNREASTRLARLYRQLGEPQKAVQTMEGLINRLEKSGEPQDIEALAGAMREYEQTVAEHEKDFSEERERTLRRLRELSVESAPTEGAEPEQDRLMMEDIEPLPEESVPIINVGGLEPVIAVPEESEEIKLEEVEEPAPEEPAEREVAIEDERPPNLVNLLKDQELYEENPALALFEKPPVLAPPPRPQPQPAAPAPAPQIIPAAVPRGFEPAAVPRGSEPAAVPRGFEVGAPAAMPGPAPGTLGLSPQGESVLANSLRESVAAQSKVVEKLFDEIKDLSRRIDQRNAQPPMPPIMIPMPQPSAAPSFPPPMYLPPAQAQPEGLPRYARPEPHEEEEAVLPPPSRPMPSPAARLRAAAAPPLASRPAQPAAPASLLQTPAAPGPGEQTEAPSPAPRGWPGLEPFTETEPEPELEPSVVEEPEAMLEPVEDVHPPPAVTEAEAPATEEAPSAPEEAGLTLEEPAAERPSEGKSGDEVRKELRDYFNGVREKLESGSPQAGAPAAAPPRAGGPEKSGPSGLLDYLGKLSDYLPEREKKRFRGSSERLAMESLKSRLAGTRGLLRKVSESFPAVAPRRKEPMTRSLVVDTFSYLKDLSAWHPDKTVGAAMRERIESIVARMGRWA
jgi:tetratricopeptide (TPR) repeat protein